MNLADNYYMEINGCSVHKSLHVLKLFTHAPTDWSLNIVTITTTMHDQLIVAGFGTCTEP